MSTQSKITLFATIRVLAIPVHEKLVDANLNSQHEKLKRLGLLWTHLKVLVAVTGLLSK